MNRRENGDGSLYFDKKRGYWRASITLPNGTRKDFCGKNKSRVIKKRDEFRANNYTEEKKSNKTLKEIMIEVIELRYQLGFFGENTYRGNMDIIKRIAKNPIANKIVSSITVNDINNFFVDELDKNFAKETIQKDKSMLSRAFHYAYENTLIGKNPMDSQTLAYTKALKTARNGKVEALTVEEQKKFLNIITENEDELYPYSYLWQFLLLTGVRVGEACALSVDDIDFTNKKIKISKTITRDYLGLQKVGAKTKNGKDRTITYGTAVEQLLDKIIERRDTSCPYLFNVNKDFIRPNTSCTKLRKFNKQYQIASHLSNHMLRHTYATRLIEEGIPADVIQHALGHSSVEITIDRYTSFFQEREYQYTNEIDQYWQELL